MADAKGKLPIKLNDEDGNAYSVANPLPVQSSLGTCSHDVNTETDLAAAGSADHDFLKGSTGVFLGIDAGSAVCGKIEVLVGAVASEALVATFYLNAADNDIQWRPPCAISLSATDNIKITYTNRDNVASDFSSTIYYA